MPHLDKKWVEKQFENFSEKIQSTFSKASDLKNYITKTGNISDTTATFEESKELENISSDDKTSTVFGKIKKWFAELPGTRVAGSILTLTDFNQLNNTYRYWKISELDASYAEEIGIRNVGDFWAFILSYNGDGNTFHFGNIILTSPRLVNNDYYKITMWDGVPHVTLSRGYVPSLTNNFLATVPGQSALDAALGPVLKGTLDAATQMLFLDHPKNKEEVYDFIYSNRGLFVKTQSLSIMIYSEGAVLGAGEGSGMFVGTLYHFNGNIIGELINLWDQNQKLSLLTNTYMEEKYIIIKTVSYTHLQQQINQLNSDLLRWKSFPATGTGSIEINVSDKLPARARVISAINSFIPGAGEYHVVGFSDNTSTLFFNKIVPAGTPVSITVIYNLQM